MFTIPFKCSTGYKYEHCQQNYILLHLYRTWIDRLFISLTFVVSKRTLFTVGRDYEYPLVTINRKVRPSTLYVKHKEKKIHIPHVTTISYTDKFRKSQQFCFHGIFEMLPELVTTHSKQIESARAPCQIVFAIKLRMSSE